MKRNALLFCVFSAAVSLPAVAAAPPFETVAPVAYMVDLSSGAVLYARDADRQIPPASMAKMMTTHLAFHLIKRRELTLNKMCQVRPETWRQWHGPQAGSTMFLSPGEQVSVENLLHGIVTLSGNDATVVLAECVAGTEPAFVALMNAEAKRLGMTNSRFGNSNGWPDQFTLTTARDLAKLAAATIQETPDLYKAFYQKESFTWGRTLGGGQPITQGNRNPLLGRVPGADGLKTGHTEEAGYGFTGSAEQNGRRLIMVVAGLSSFNQRIEESVKFMDWGFRAWKAQPLFTKGEKVGEAQVQLGDEDTVPLVAPRNLAVTLPAGVSSGNMRVKVVYNGPIKAPIRQGQHVADLIVQTGDTPPQSMPLIAAEAVGEAGFFDRLWAGVASIFA
ncbi:MAG: D-alanyl-D-alanine carboxypeptidase [Pseudomonadota bacterium]|nr:D-alanyl-D-alanine carboxypeptidase [Pseudomonadota bacterium]